MKSMLWMLFALLLMGCGGVTPASHQATLRAEMSGYVAEATAIRQAADSDLERIVGTVVALEQEMLHKAAVNVALHATLQAVRPDVVRSAANIGGAPTPIAILEGRRWFIKTGMSSHVDNNGCNDMPGYDFSTTTPTIYATFMAYNIEGGTPLSASWSHNGVVMHQESFNLAGGASEICLWFSIDPQTVTFDPGLWTVQLYAEGFPLESAMPFQILAES